MSKWQKLANAPLLLGLVLMVGLLATWPRSVEAQEAVPVCANGWGRECAEHQVCAGYDPRTGMCANWNIWYYNWTLN
jgi:hypothetical protein